jgi:hypothetical protein
MVHIREHYGSWQRLIRVKDHPTLVKQFNWAKSEQKDFKKILFSEFNFIYAQKK